MPFQTHCVCGEKILEAIDPETITTTEGARYVFRRDTDFIACNNCERVHPVNDLRAEISPHLSVVKDES